MICTAWVQVSLAKVYCYLQYDHAGQHVCEVDGQTVMWSQR